MGENQQPWLRKLANLGLSLQSAGGTWGSRQLEAYLVDAPGPHGALRTVGVRTVAVPPVRERSPLNKLVMFRHADPGRTLLALDCDVVVADELVPSGAPDAVAGCPAEHPLLVPGRWHELFAALGLPLLAEPLTSAVSGRPIPVPYLNSGVLVLPGRWAAELAEVWEQYADAVREHPALGPWSDILEFHLDQIALACALSALRLPVSILPLEYNVPYCHPGPTRVRALHYHRRIGADGLLTLPRAAPAREVARRFNAGLRACGLVSADWPDVEHAPSRRRHAGVTGGH